MLKRFLCWSPNVVLTMTVFASVILLKSKNGETANFEQFRNPESWEKDWFANAQDTLDETVRTTLNRNVAKNVIIFLGDGMGISTVTAGRIYTAQKEKRFPGEESSLAFDRFPHVALSKTYLVDYQVADSAATATAFLCGVKANLGTVGVSQKVRRQNCDDMLDGGSVDSILRWSISEGKRAGVVTTTRVTHATPAGSYAHSPDRDWECDDRISEGARHKCEDIAKQLITRNSDINVILGGGRRNFLPRTVQDPEYPGKNGSRLDGINLIQMWEDSMTAKSNSHAYVWNHQLFDQVDPEDTDYLLGLFEPSHMQIGLRRHLDGAGEPSLAEMTEKAIRILRRSKGGFFLLVEGGRIDHGHHINVAKIALDELALFNDAIKRAISLTDQLDTLIVVTADHSHVFTISGYPSRGNPILGFVDERNEEPAKDGMPYLTLSYANGPSTNFVRKNMTGVDTEADNFTQPILVRTRYETHGGEDVAIYASGPMSHLFTGVREQHYIPHAMAYASCVGSNKRHCSYARGSTVMLRISSILFLVNVLFNILTY